MIYSIIFTAELTQTVFGRPFCYDSPTDPLFISLDTLFHIDNSLTQCGLEQKPYQQFIISTKTMVKPDFLNSLSPYRQSQLTVCFDIVPSQKLHQ